jgi:uncharacterized protein YdhG (YjbR/CyaY superfamily)
MAAATIDEFLASVPEEKRRALEDLRHHVRRAVPDATESINYGVPAFKLDGRPLVSFGASKEHCSFYVQSPAVVEAFADELRDFRLTKGSVTFQPDRPIPADLVARLVQARVDELRKR